jgi:carbamoyltransferase
MNILGLNIFHSDSSACVIKNGVIIAASEEERFNRIKHYAGFPINSAMFCLEQANLKITDIDFVAINSDKYYNLNNRLLYILKNFFNILLYSKFKSFFKKSNLKKYVLKNLNISDFAKFKIVNVSHHLSHASSIVNLFSKPSGVSLSVDGSGDFSTLEAYQITNGKFKLIDKEIFPNSLGFFYQAFTQFLGFPNYGDEYKVMGLSAYGEPVYVDRVYKLFNKKNFFSIKLKYFNVRQNFFPNLYTKKIEYLFGKPRKEDEPIIKVHKDIAASVQKVFEDTIINKLNKLYAKFPSENLFFSGGCAFNSLAAGKITKNTNFKNIFISSNSGDAGGALGAAIYVAKKYDKFINDNDLLNPFLGINFSNNYISKNIKSLADKKNFKSFFFTDEKKFFDFVSDEIIKKKIIGWFQGRSEWGPRALGNRSILADPRIKNIKDIINTKIKKREEFRPFAPSILSEFSKEYFNFDMQESNLMAFVVEAKQIAKETISACVHVDGTSRIQTVNIKFNEKFYKLIYSFYNKTGIPVLLNTSLNINEPICNTPEDAWNLFCDSELETLVLENWVFKKMI